MPHVRKSLISLALAAATLMGAQFAGGSDALAATVPSVAAAQAPVVKPMTGVWVPWDGNRITTEAKCNARAAYLTKTYNEHFKCVPESNPCGPGVWIVYVWRANGFIVNGTRD
jgi:hypothetical protein